MIHNPSNDDKRSGGGFSLLIKKKGMTDEKKDECQRGRNTPRKKR